MPYIFKQKNFINWAALKPKTPSVVLIVEPQYSLARLYGRHLEENNFEVCFCDNLQDVEDAVLFYNPHVCILNPQAHQGLSHALKTVDSLSKARPELAIVTIGFDLSGEHIKQLMEAGVVSHIDRRLSRPKDLSDILKVLIKKV